LQEIQYYYNPIKPDAKEWSTQKAIVHEDYERPKKIKHNLASEKEETKSMSIHVIRHH